MRCHIKERTGKELGKNRVPSLTIGPQDPALIGAGEKLHNKEFNYLYPTIIIIIIVTIIGLKRRIRKRQKYI